MYRAEAGTTERMSATDPIKKSVSKEAAERELERQREEARKRAEGND